MFCKVYDIEKGKTPQEVFKDLDWDLIAKEAESNPMILRGIFSRDDTTKIKETIKGDFRNSKPAPDTRYYLGCPNVYKTLDRDYFYYRPEKRALWNYFLWNAKSSHPVYELGLPLISIINRLAGLPENYGHDPKCGHFYTLSAMCYPKGGGFLGPHVDSYAQKYQALVIMSQLGEDFSEGGLFCFDKDLTNCFIEPELNNGDLLLLPSTVVHGVYPIDPKVRGSHFEGRWGFFTPMPSSSLLVEGPGISKPVTIDQYIPKNI